MITLSAIQFAPNLAFSAAEVAANVKRAIALVDKAISMKSDLIVLPELAFTGYCYLSEDEAMSASEKMNGPTYKILSEYAKSGDCYIAYGFVENRDGTLYNSCNLIGPDGDILVNYHKINLFGNDFLWAKSGSSAPPIINTPFGTLSTIVCRDIRLRIPKNIPRLGTDTFFPKTPRILAACTNWGKGGFPSNTWMDLCSDHHTTLVLANRFGTEKNNGFEAEFGPGGSIIIEPSWKIHRSGLKFNDNCVVSAAFETFGA